MIRVRKSNTLVTQTDGETQIDVRITLTDFKDADQATKFLKFFGQQILVFEGQKKLED